MSTPSFITQLDWADTAGHLTGAGTVLLAVGFSVPQLARMRRRRSAAGVSLPAVLNSAISFLAWTLHAVDIGDAWLIASSAIGLPGAVLTAVVAWRCGASTSGLWLPALWVATLVTGLADLLGTTSAFGVAVGASIAWLVVPAVVKAWLSTDVSALAAASWWVLAAEGALFLGYGLAQAVLAATVYGVLCLLGSFGVLSRLAVPVRSAAGRPTRVPAPAATGSTASRPRALALVGVGDPVATAGRSERHEHAGHRAAA